MAKLNSSNIGPGDNVIINGDFNIWQRGISFPSISSAAYHADRFLVGTAGAMRYTAALSTDVPTVSQSGHKSNYSVLLDCTTVDTSLTTTDHFHIIYGVEGLDVKALMGKVVTLSFWVKATKTGTYCVSFSNPTDRSYIVEYTVNTTDTWEKKIITLTMHDGSSGTWDYGVGLGMAISFVLASGPTYRTSTLDEWQTGLYLASNNQVNGCDNVANDFRLSQVKLEIGSVATPFGDRDFHEEHRLCQRYYEVSGTAAWANSLFRGWDVTISNPYYMSRAFNVIKRATPTIVLTAVGQSGFNGSPGLQAAAVNGLSIYEFATVTTNGAYYGAYWTADAELI